jgi:hypothetical protein
MNSSLRLMGTKWLLFFFFFQLANIVLLRYETHDRYKMVGKPNKSRLQATFLIMYGTHVNILFIIKR